MTNEQWDKVVENIKANFKNAQVFEEELESGFEGGKTVHADVLVFSAPHGRFRLVRETRPLVLDKKQLYSHRPGDTARTEYTFSDTEVTHKIRLYKEDSDLEWEEVSLDQLEL